MMAESQCRVCGNNMRSTASRRNHELTIHRLTVIDGQTYSRTPYVVPLNAPSTPVQISSIPASHVTTLADTPTGSQSQSVSPGVMSAASTESMGSGTTPPPRLFLTPSPGLHTARRSAASASPLGRDVRPRISSRSASVAPAMPTGRAGRAPNDPGNRKCKYCLWEFYSHAEMNRHLRQNRCIFQFRPSDHNMADYCVLRRPPNYNQTAAILSQLTIADRVKMCRLNCWAMPGLWPLVFPGTHRQRFQTPRIINEMTAAGESTNILRSLLRTEARVELPKQIVVIDEESNIQSILPSEVLRPGSSFETRIVGDQIMVTPGKKSFYREPYRHDIYCQALAQFQFLVHSWSYQYHSYSVLFRLVKLDQEVMLFSLCHHQPP